MSKYKLSIIIPLQKTPKDFKGDRMRIQSNLAGIPRNVSI